MAWSLADIATEIAAIESVMSGRVTNDIESYTLADGRAVTKIPMRELRKHYEFLKAEQARLTAEASIAAGTGNPRKVRVRFI